MEFMTVDSRIILFSSIAAEVPMRTTSVYCSTKAAVDMLTKCLARELAPRAVFCIKPGPTEGVNSWVDCMYQIKEMRGWSFEKIMSMTLADIPMEKLATELQCAEATYHCLFEAPDHASGTVYRLTGGR
jgi:NAD(P)-dependent dehydrogenase (short-subunit alcohol dehydrogenase family)